MDLSARGSPCQLTLARPHPCIALRISRLPRPMVRGYAVYIKRLHVICLFPGHITGGFSKPIEMGYVDAHSFGDNRLTTFQECRVGTPGEYLSWTLHGPRLPRVVG